MLVYFHWKLERDIARDYGCDLQPLPEEQQTSCWKIIRRIFALSLPVSAASIMLLDEQASRFVYEVWAGEQDLLAPPLRDYARRLLGVSEQGATHD